MRTKVEGNIFIKNETVDKLEEVIQIRVTKSESLS